MRTFWIIATLLAFALTGCSKDKTTTDSTQEGGPALLSISLKLPRLAVETRYEEGDEVSPNPWEDSYEYFSVYIFNSDGKPASEGAHHRFHSNYFSGDASLSTLDHPIETTAGTKHIYIGINVPEAYDHAYANETAFLAARASVNDLGASQESYLTLFSKAETITLQPAGDDTNNPVLNKPGAIETERVLSKVVATFDGSHPKLWSLALDENGKVIEGSHEGNYIMYGPQAFFVYNNVKASYMAPNFAPGSTVPLTLPSVVTSFDENNEKYLYNPSLAQTMDATSNLSYNSNHYFYIGENAPARTTFGATTYIMIRMVCTVWYIEKVKDDGTGVERVKLDTPFGGGNTGAGGSSGESIFVIKHNGRDYITDSAHQNSLRIYLAALSPTDVDPVVYDYYRGYVYFPVFLNRDGTNNYAVGRSQFIHVDAQGIIKVEGRFPGYPGYDSQDCEIPSNPMSNDLNNPYPLNPDDLIDGEPAGLRVNLSVSDWEPVNGELTLN